MFFQIVLAPGERRNSQKDRDESKEDVPTHFRVRHTFIPFTVLLMEGDTVYYTTPQAKKQAGNA